MRALALAKLAHCGACLESHRDNLREDPDHRAVWRRLITEAEGDARYWAVEFYLCGGR